MWAIYWRFLLAVLTVFLLTVLTVQFLPILQFIANSHYHPSAFWLVATFIAMAISQLTSKGLVHAYFGKRLQLCPTFWSRINVCLFGLLGFLAACALVVQAVATPAGWANYKLYFQPVVLILGPWVAGSFMLHQVKHNNLL
ncbi:hypothetical protein [Alteromonas facilis]|uniref:hypothetical protein n=1 Tax=Alteromonas facilis TaxID=2048004 RepID=UPI000C282BF8|nr:hypothetical protein [Alteromonas facilis]